MLRKKTDRKSRFLSSFTVMESDCWEWTASKYYNGYGQFYDGVNKICAHRYSYKHFIGEIPKGLLVCHKCDNRSCVNPSHLFLGTQKDNLQDMIKKGRARRGIHLGENNGNVKLTENDVIEMRSKFDNKISIAEIAKQHNISETQASRIVKRTAWKFLK